MHNHYSRNDVDRFYQSAGDNKQCLQRAKECFEALCTVLGTRYRYIFGNTPSSLDALLFGILACILMPTEDDIPDSALSDLLHEYGNLCTMVNDIAHVYFGDLYSMETEMGNDGTSYGRAMLSVERVQQAQEDEEQQKKTAMKSGDSHVSTYRSRKLWFWGLLTFTGALWAYANRQHFVIMALQLAGGQIRLVTDDNGQSYHAEVVLPMEDTYYSSIDYDE